MEVIRTSSLLKEAKIIDYYRYYSEEIPVKCSFCGIIPEAPKVEAPKTKRTKTFHSLKELSWHLAHFHSNEVGYPFSFEQVQEILRVLALAKEWGILK
jgi:hypothetical protein